jgi:uncharacterized membrane protein YfcA
MSKVNRIMPVALSPQLFELSLLLVSVLAGLVGALLGLGGGVIIVPALTLLFHVPIRYAVGASIVSVIATSSGAAATYVRDHLTNVRVAMLLEVATTVGAIGGATLSHSIPDRALFLTFALILLYSAGAMFRKRRETMLSDASAPRDPLATRLKLHSSYPDRALGRDVAYFVTGVPLALSLMLGAGVISGLLGIGSGALKVPAMDSAMRLPIKVSSATSNFMIGVTAAASAGAYYMHGDILPLLAAPVAIGVLLGSWAGTRLMTRLNATHLRKLFVAVLLIIALQMGLRAFGVNIR